MVVVPNLKVKKRDYITVFVIVLFPSLLTVQFLTAFPVLNWMVGRPASLGGQLLNIPFFLSPID